MSQEQPLFWSDQLAFGVTQKFSDKDVYVCASGISPSGIVHAGNFREIITTDFVVKSLKNRGEKTRFIYSWDDYDRFRKVPENVPDKFEKYIGLPLSKVPSPEEGYNSYADYFESRLEKELEDMHMDIEFIRQTEMFENCEYTELIKKAMKNRGEIREILNQYRTEPLKQDWYPLRVYCKECGKDFTEITDYNGKHKIEYRCEECGEKHELNFSKEGCVKPPWRVDWPMRWHYEDVSFEPGGKDHSAAGSSRDTGSEIIEKIYKDEPPIYQMYDFITPKGGDKKISSSAGENTLTLTDLKEVYSPEIIRFLFSETKPNKEFSIPFDEDIFQRYEKFDKIEDAYFNPDKMDNERKREHWKRVYELAMVEIPEEKPVRIPFQHAAFVAQTVPKKEWRTKGIESLKRTGHIPEDASDQNIEQVIGRLKRARNWGQKHAPKKYKYSINFKVPENVKKDLSVEQKDAIQILIEKLQEKEFKQSDNLDKQIFDAKKESELGTGEFFNTAYKILLSREQGPRLSRLILSIGQEETIKILQQTA